MIITELSNEKYLQYRKTVHKMTLDEEYGYDWGVYGIIESKVPDNENQAMTTTMEVFAPFISEKKVIIWTSNKLKLKDRTRQKELVALFEKAVKETKSWVAMYRYLSGYNSNRSENFDYYKQSDNNLVFIP